VTPLSPGLVAVGKTAAGPAPTCAAVRCTGSACCRPTTLARMRLAALIVYLQRVTG
jgi:hypothetical protein